MTLRITLIVSLVLNSILLMAVLGPVPFFLYLSILLNAGLIWFVRNLINELSDINKDMEELLDTTASLQNHIEKIYELEMFYGDQTLEELIQHTKSVVSEIEFFKEKYSSELEEEELYDDSPEEREEA
jgi:ABC-type multidrug transport system fused ATPase/permease subunit